MTEICLCCASCGCSGCMPICDKCGIKHHGLYCPKGKTCECQYCVKKNY